MQWKGVIVARPTTRYYSHGQIPQKAVTLVNSNLQRIEHGIISLKVGMSFRRFHAEYVSVAPVTISILLAMHRSAFD
jgi:hypothetical protein